MLSMRSTPSVVRSQQCVVATEQPSCRSHRNMYFAMQILNTLQMPYETVNILEDELLRSGMKEYSQWPTFPQVYVDGEFYGGCDIMIGTSYPYNVNHSKLISPMKTVVICCVVVASEGYTNGELKEHLEAALNS